MSEDRPEYGKIRGEFDAATHSYRINGRPVPSVTQVLRDLIPGWNASEWHMQRGTAVHACAAMIARGVAFEHDPQIEGYVEALRAWFRIFRPVVLAVETPVFSARHQYAGRIDLVADFLGKKTVIDFKTGIMPETAVYQLAAYSIAFEETEYCKVPWGMVVEIHNDGTYRVSREFDLKRAKQEWLALLTAYNVRRKCKVPEGNKKEGSDGSGTGEG